MREDETEKEGQKRVPSVQGGGLNERETQRRKERIYPRTGSFVVRPKFSQLTGFMLWPTDSKNINFKFKVRKMRLFFVFF